MMMRVAQPLQRRKERIAAQPLLRAPDNLAQQQAVGMQRHVAPVLFMRGDGNDDGSILAEGLNIRPLKFGEFDKLEEESIKPTNVKQGKVRMSPRFYFG